MSDLIAHTNPSQSKPFLTDSQTQLMLESLKADESPLIYPYVNKLLISFSVLYFLIIILAISILAIPILRGTEERRKHIWLWRRQYFGAHSAYYNPNGALSVVISLAIGSVIFEIYILLTYQALQNPEETLSNSRYFWLCISYAPGFYGFWFSGFNSLYISLLSPSRTNLDGFSSMSYIPPPYIMNTACIGIPILVSLMSIGWAIGSIIVDRDKQAAYHLIRSLLSDGLDPSPGWTEYHLAQQRFLFQYRWACFSWSIAAAMAVIFYSLTVFKSLRLFKGSVDVASGKLSLLTPANSSDRESSLEPGLRPKTFAPSTHNHQFSHKLKNDYRMLLWHFGFLSTVLVWYLVVGVFLTVRSALVIEDPVWRSISVWIVISSGILLSLALLVRSWRLISDRSDPQNRTPTAFKPTQASAYAHATALHLNLPSSPPLTDEPRVQLAHSPDHLIIQKPLAFRQSL